ncbi:MAG: ATP-dependent 6-phosphofructokinase [Anaerohalosphaeraceae bacterium]|nr:ATP-dependent 6-phosphofructokinase [Anaerohalosphaeraceae bacterium]
MSNDKYLIKTLGECKYDSPILEMKFVADDERICIDPRVKNCTKDCSEPASFESSGPREKIFFDPAQTRMAIVTCGGLCPGLNDVIRAIVMVSWYRYGVRNILGVRFGYAGLNPENGHPPTVLIPDIVEDIHRDGGTILGSSRGAQDSPAVVDYLVKREIDILFTIGGDGTQKGALDIAKEIEKRKLNISVVGIPKTIDNDIAYTERTFGFSTAVSAAESVIRAGHMEAKGYQNGIGLIKLMGRDSGFIAAHAAIASGDANFVLIPEVPFTLEGFLKALERRLQNKSHVVVVTAEGAGQELVTADGCDKSGNKKLGDIGLFLKSEITERFRKIDKPVSIKYIDPSYTIRSVPANAEDSVFCFQLAENAVHAAMSGRTEMIASLWNSKFVYVPSRLAVTHRKNINADGMLWQSVLESTGQPHNMM